MNWLPKTANDPVGERLADFRLVINRAARELEAGRDPNMVYHDTVSAILRFVRPPMVDYDKPVDGTVEIL